MPLQLQLVRTSDSQESNIKLIFFNMFLLRNKILSKESLFSLFARKIREYLKPGSAVFYVVKYKKDAFYNPRINDPRRIADFNLSTK